MDASVTSSGRDLAGPEQTAVHQAVMGPHQEGARDTCCFRITAIVQTLDLCNLFMYSPCLVSDIKNKIEKNK